VSVPLFFCALLDLSIFPRHSINIEVIPNRFPGEGSACLPRHVCDLQVVGNRSCTKGSRLYGTTYFGGANGRSSDGTVFSLSAVGVAVTILGTSLTGSTSVTFNGTAATFTVKSKSEITTTVPAGATTGTVLVVTPGGTLSSNVPFRVTP
jgi:uncharacterized repeat protein (TIGR03803 family)